MIRTHVYQETSRKHTAVRYTWIVVGLVVACLALFTPRAAHAQASAGITGTIVDPSGAVVPNAQVTVTNEGTSVAAWKDDQRKVIISVVSERKYDDVMEIAAKMRASMN